MLGYKFTLENANGDSIVINDHDTDPLRLIALQDYPISDVEIKNQEADREGQHGIWDFNSFYGKRVMTFSGVIVGENEADVENLKKQLLKVITLPPIPTAENNGYITVKWEDAEENEWQISAKLNGYPRFTRNMRETFRLNFTFTLKSKNPEIESQQLFELSGNRGWSQGYLELPTTLPALFDIVYNNVVMEDGMGVVNNGTMDAHTIITLAGESAHAITNPCILNLTTGKIFKVNITLNGPDEYIVINSKDGSVVDQDGNDQSALVDSESEYIMLTVGDNRMVFLSDESFGEDGPLTTWVYPQALVIIKHRTTII